MTDPRTCRHANVEPVEVRDWAGVFSVVAQLCIDCLEQLPAAWGCDECEWVDVQRLCDPVPTLLLGRPCQVHA